MRILFVCTGNMCRSPLAERLTTSRAERSLGAWAARVHVDSAGTDAVDGRGMDGRSAQVLAAEGARRRVSQDDDVLDPIGQASRVHRDVAEQIAACLEPLTDLLFTPANLTAQPRTAQSAEPRTMQMPALAAGRGLISPPPPPVWGAAARA